MRRQRITFFTADDPTAPVVGSVVTFTRSDGSTGVTVLDPTFSTDPAHPRGVLVLVEADARGESTVNLRDGTGSIGTTQVEILDRAETPGDQQTGVASRILPDVLSGARAILDEETADGSGVFDVLADLVVGNVTIHASYASYLVTLRDAQESTREVRLFVRGETTTIVAPGVLDGYGKTVEWRPGALPGQPSTVTTTYVIPPAPILTAIFYRDAGGVDADAGYLFRSGSRWNDYRQPWDAFEANVMPRLSAGRAYEGLQGYLGRRFDGVVVRWRTRAVDNGGVAGPWVYCRNMPLLDRFPGTVLLEDKVWHPFFLTDKNAGRRGPFGPGSGAGYVAAQMSVDGGSRQVGALIAVAITRTTGDATYTLPAHNQEVEFQLIAAGEPTAVNPMVLELPPGDLLERSARGDYSDEAPHVRLSPDGMARFRAATDGITLRVWATAAEKDMRAWWRDRLFKPLRWALAVNNDGELEPVPARIPGVNVVLPTLTDANVEPSATWVRDASLAVTAGEFVYYRDYVTPLGNVGPGDSHYTTPLERLRSVPVRYNDVSIRGVRLLGRQEVTIDATTVRSVSTQLDAQHAVDLPTEQEEGHQMAAEAVSQMIERFPNSGQVVGCVARLDAPGVAALRRGDFLVCALTYLPNGETKRRGLNRLMQVTKRKLLNRRWVQLQLDDVGDGAGQPLPAPTIANLRVLGDGRAAVDVTAVPSVGGARVGVLVEAAVGLTEPDPDSGDWGLVSLPLQGAPSPAAPYTVTMPAPPAAATLYVRALSTRPGARPSGPSATLALAVAALPAIRAAALSLDLQPDGTVRAVVRWRASPSARGVRFYALPTVAGADLPTAAAVLAGGAVTHAAAPSGAAIGGEQATDLGPVAAGAGVAVVLVPYAAFDALAVPPTAGTAGLASLVLLRERSAPVAVALAAISVSEHAALDTPTTAAFDLDARAPGGGPVTIQRRTGVTVDAVKAAAWSDLFGPLPSPLVTTDATAPRPVGVVGYVQYRATADGVDPSPAEQRKVAGQVAGSGGGPVPPALDSQSVAVTARGTSCADRGVVTWAVAFAAAMPAGWTFRVTVQGAEFGPFTGASAGDVVAGTMSGGYGTGGGTMDLSLSWVMLDEANAVRASDGTTVTVPGWAVACLVG